MSNNMERTRYTVKFWYSTYVGTREIVLDDDDPRSPIDAMWAQMRNRGELGLPMAYQSAKIVMQEPEKEQ